MLVNYASDHEVFQMPLKVCELTRCRATCCHDGVYLSPEEKDTLARVIDEKAETLAGYVAEQPGDVADPWGVPPSLHILQFVILHRPQ